MQAYRVETTLVQKGKLTLTNLPFQQGERVEIIILPQPVESSRQHDYSLQGSVLDYINPTDPIAQQDWEALS